MFGIHVSIPMLAAFMSLACWQEETDAIAPQSEVKKTTVAIEITSSAFTHGNSIPALYSCDSDEVSPELSWSWIPESTKTIPAAPGYIGLSMAYPLTTVGFQRACHLRTR